MNSPIDGLLYLIGQAYFVNLLAIPIMYIVLKKVNSESLAKIALVLLVNTKVTIVASYLLMELPIENNFVLDTIFIPAYISVAIATPITLAIFYNLFKFETTLNPEV